MDSIKAISSPYFVSKGTKFPIYKGIFKLKVKNSEFELDGTVELTLVPKPSIKFEGTCEGFDLSLLDSKGMLLCVKGMYATRASLDLVQNDYYIRGQVIGELKSDGNQMIDTYYLNIMNYVKYLGDPIYNEKFHFRGGLGFNLGNWKIKLHMRHDYKDESIFQKLEDTNGFNFTHILEIKRIDDSLFYEGDINEIKELILWVLNFTSGRHIGAPIQIGERENELVLKNFSTPLLSPYKRIPNWFPKQRGGSIKELLLLLNKRFEDEFLKQSIKEIIHWYIEALNTLFIENKTVNSQIALEKLSYILLTQQSPPIISNKQYKENSFRINLEKTLELTKVVTELTGDYIIFKDNFVNGPDLLIKYRNHIAHPKRNQKIDHFSSKSKYLIMNLGMYYTEMLLLYLIGYSGVHANRLKFSSWEGNYEVVPWET
ncbi:hypothetical protein [Pontibacillus litoralis]|uniref:YopA central domain-containing protein n=1 Tax=Pontibacillus litoralis JSM 072002 TaxID=1385512 RepID=A0A0A5G472_9BACI|nr:hypothetical protein [Pontibacillus litoralis]KGX85885.1 hypothetical protein N784_06690 [Pontibacillus litoralis JSM 072002]